mmetsp:Transcript_1466/g.1741  ORF Transcript_1466/g.1741 Transcript_1466/m.1741 type:complete len:88 (-) Transcript_1466:191-454(-)
MYVCECLFNAEVGSIEIIQKEQENYSVPQNFFLTRICVIKPNIINTYPGSNVNKSPNEIYDFRIGNVVVMSNTKLMMPQCNSHMIAL